MSEGNLMRPSGPSPVEFYPPHLTPALLNNFTLKFCVSQKWWTASNVYGHSTGSDIIEDTGLFIASRLLQR